MSAVSTSRGAKSWHTSREAIQDTAHRGYGEEPDCTSQNNIQKPVMEGVRCAVLAPISHGARRHAEERIQQDDRSVDAEVEPRP